MRAVPWEVMPELSSVVESAHTEYEGKVVEVNIEDSSQNEYVVDGETVTEYDEDSDWWEEAIKFADNVENIDHAASFCKLEDNGYADADADADWWMHAGNIMDQIEGQLVSHNDP
ncbi:hypothetical protein PR202_gb20727 [Eleusine coracana subsp. coracana]|uniref:Uncharacterized protein n=1 Tax=Eleusine coracana subsp. coracana TaxID=191504 RepID=A0AAV5FDB4_ELECO|nr:hypothetical protein PR202_gb20727 [Eleusine coracana subsp. coracana]